MNVRDILQPLVDLIQTGYGSLDTELYRVEKDIVKAMDNREARAYDEGYAAGLAAEREPLDPSEGR